MAVIANLTKQKLEAGELAIGMGVRLARGVDIAKVAKVCGHDWLFIDMEHSPLSLQTVADMSVAALDAGCTPVVRASSHLHHHASRPLDAGAQGIVVPHVNSAAEAERVVSQCRYPPLGHRSLAGGAPLLEYAALPMDEAMRLQNDNVLVVVMLESPEAIAAADAIAAVEGVDALLIGTNDLCAEMRIPGQYDHPDVVAAYQRMIDACRNNGKHAGLGGVYDDLAGKYIRMGVRLVLGGSDLSYLMAAARGRSGALRGIDL
ncbi:MAG: aldolase/citrate lyase family protein [Alphaproteobacteria bacterium]|jgi:2-keto-3-deoxy-L-rhamnonate aldolase RhmA|nr:aldolase/citrate lyase family protein [Alphaproteobacteria bacterium]MDP6565732.1 aldolase/citrate lyase family protein [Alphaproteobacteria bacterium]MDP6814606.1 aldolase/citrate lyase family protein [Alphaproteobacteria bacterium]